MQLMIGPAGEGVDYFLPENAALLDAYQVFLKGEYSEENLVFLKAVQEL